MQYPMRLPTYLIHADNLNADNLNVNNADNLKAHIADNHNANNADNLNIGNTYIHTMCQQRMLLNTLQQPIRSLRRCGLAERCLQA